MPAPTILAALDPWFVRLNLAEAALWATIGVGFLVAAVVSPSRRATKVVAAITLLAFGGSDVVESRTGAWYDPPALLAWKAACVVVLAGLVFAHLARARATRRGRAAGPSPATSRRSAAG